MRALCVTIALIALAAAARADGPSAPTIEGRWGFDWLRPQKSRCVKVDGALLERLRKGYSCAAPDAGGASGKTIVARCTARKGRSELLLLASESDCKEERETQLANGE
jgi:hypothetical protein